VRRLLLAVVAAAALTVPAAAAAHPLGNFSVNHYSRIELAGDGIYVRYALDLAEIPSFQERSRLARPGYAAALAGGLDLRVDGRRARLRTVDSRIERRRGAAGLETVRIDAVFRADRAGSRLEYRDRNYAGRAGWRELVVVARDGAELRSSTVPSRDASRELRAYPPNRLSQPLRVGSAEATFALGASPAGPPALGGPAGSERRGGGFEALVEGELTAGVVALSLLLALFWGAAHALTPGHGKAIVAAYLVGSRGTARHALLLGLIVTVTHTLGVFLLGIVTLSLSAFIVPETLYPWMNLISALLVVAVGVAVVRSRVRDWRRPRAHHHHHHHHHHGHHHHDDHGHHHHGHGHHHHEPPVGGIRGLVAVGISGGLLPCPTALVVLLAAISLHRVGFGLLLIVAFSVGLAAVISGIGLLAIGARSVFGRMSFEGRAIRALPALSALAILCVGVAMTARALSPLT
jgi:ABC-type nickel/cobalt efflux system permease component RcnA